MKERIITAICLLAVVIPVVALGGYWFMMLILIAAATAALEMVNMHHSLIEVPVWIKGMPLIATLGIVWVQNIWVAWIILGVYLIFLMIVYAWKKTNIKTTSFYTIAVVYIAFSFRALLEIRAHSLVLFILLITTVILTDSAAYFAGRCFGKHKLAPKISPKKTIEGAIGGWLVGAGFAIAFGLHNSLFTQNWILIVLAVGLPILSQIGDLVASAFKRHYGIKDYGKIFPGHGGVMDRIDSQMLAAILIYAIILIGGVAS